MRKTGIAAAPVSPAPPVGDYGRSAENRLPAIFTAAPRFQLGAARSPPTVALENAATDEELGNIQVMIKALELGRLIKAFPTGSATKGTTAGFRVKV